LAAKLDEKLVRPVAEEPAERGWFGEEPEDGAEKEEGPVELEAGRADKRCCVRKSVARSRLPEERTEGGGGG
jgi:hypothetical protein